MDNQVDTIKTNNNQYLTVATNKTQLKIKDTEDKDMVDKLNQVMANNNQAMIQISNTTRVIIKTKIMVIIKATDLIDKFEI